MVPPPSDVFPTVTSVSVNCPESAGARGSPTMRTPPEIEPPTGSAVPEIPGRRAIGKRTTPTSSASRPDRLMCPDVTNELSPGPPSGRLPRSIVESAEVQVRLGREAHLLAQHGHHARVPEVDGQRQVVGRAAGARVERDRAAGEAAADQPFDLDPLALQRQLEPRRRKPAPGFRIPQRNPTLGREHAAPHPERDARHAQHAVRQARARQTHDGGSRRHARRRARDQRHRRRSVLAVGPRQHQRAAHQLGVARPQIGARVQHAVQRLAREPSERMRQQRPRGEACARHLGVDAEAIDGRLRFHAAALGRRQ